MHGTGEFTLFQRTGKMYRLLVLLQRLFQTPNEPQEVDCLGAPSDVALCIAIREILDELAEHARILTSVPIPLSEWKPGDAADDDRWRALTEVERRELLSMLSCYENLVTWGETVTTEAARAQGLDVGCALAGSPPQDLYKSIEYLKAERARVARLREDLRFLDKARGTGNARPRPAAAS